MKIITESPIEVKYGCDCKHSSADATAGDPTGRDSSNVGKRQGFFSKQKREQRQDTRKTRRTERRKARKAGARPLKEFFQGQKKLFHNLLHPVTQKADGSFVKVDGDGKEIPVDKKSLAQLDPKKYPGLNVGSDGKLLFDKLDLAGGIPKGIMDNGVARVATIIQENAAVPVTNDSGGVDYYKAEDTVDAESPEAATTKEGWSTTQKVIAGLAVAALIGGFIYMVKSKK